MKKVLLVDIDDFSSNVITQIFNDDEKSVVVAENISNALQLAKDDDFNLIITDIIGGDQSFEFIKALKEINSERPIIVISENVSRNAIQRSYQNGCSGFLPKPLNRESFLSIISPLLSMNNVQEENSQVSYYSSGNENVLIVDDNLMNAELLKAVLEQLNINSVLAPNGEIALHLIENQDFDLILLDIMMPEMSGFEVIKRIKENQAKKDIPVIFVSAMNDPKDVVKGFDLGSFAYVKKPFNTEELKAQVVNVLKIKRLQDVLRQEKEKLDKIFEYAIDGIILLDEDFKIKSCNKQFLKWLKLNDEKELIGRKVCEVTRCANFNIEDEFACECRKGFNSNNNFMQVNVVMNLESGPMHVKHSCSKIFDKAGNLTGYLCLLIDRSKDIEIERQKETFIATLTHDLKTPIRAEMRAMDLLLKGAFGELNPEQADIIKETLYSSKFMFNMVDTLLANYKYENGNMVIVKEEIDINSMILACKKELKYIIDEKQHAVTCDFEHEKEIVYVDVMEIKRLILNLLSNAINYTPEHGKIEISSFREGNMLKVSFKDNGYGISTERLGHIFDKYNTNAKKLRHVGTGLGLYISKKIVEFHDGTINVESRENVGSCFTFSIPLLPVATKEKPMLVG